MSRAIYCIRAIIDALVVKLKERATEYEIATRLGLTLGESRLLILTIEPRLWPIGFALPFVARLMVGWLGLKSGSIVPGWLVHGLGNAFSIITVMRKSSLSCYITKAQAG